MKAWGTFYIVVILVWGFNFCSEDNKNYTPDAVGEYKEEVKKEKDVEIPNDTGTKNHPPVLYKIGDKVVKVGETLHIVLEAYDPDGDTLFYSVYGDVPKSAKFLKDKGEFIYTPEESGLTLFLTFVVTDGKAFDRETVQIKVVSEKSKNPPKFVPVGDQLVKCCGEYKLVLQAVDPDNDKLIFSVEGSLPPQSTLNPETGEFMWNVQEFDKGKTYRVTFTVTDGFFTDSMEVKFIVEGEGVNHPPQIKKIGTVIGHPGELVVIKVEATDQDPGDQEKLIYGVKGEVPDNAVFDKQTHEFKWPPSPADEGKVFEITFYVSDGVNTVYENAKIIVKSEETTTECTDDEFEENNTIKDAKSVKKGDYSSLSLCSKDGVMPDIDWYKIYLQKGDFLTV